VGNNYPPASYVNGNLGNLNGSPEKDAAVCNRICLTIRGIYEKFSKIIWFILLRENKKNDPCMGKSWMEFLNGDDGSDYAELQ
jgi:hypothetical protein